MKCIGTANAFHTTKGFLYADDSTFAIAAAFGDILPKEILDPNILFEGSTVLHEAVRCDHCHATDSDPRVAQLFVCGFGANPLF
jgi:hypothetical protein